METKLNEFEIAGSKKRIVEKQLAESLLSAYVSGLAAAHGIEGPVELNQETWEIGPKIETRIP